MNIWKAFLAVPMALIAGQAQAGPNWVKIGTASGHTISIDTNDFRKGIDGLVYYSDSVDEGDTYFNWAVDCRRHVLYILGGSEGVVPDWRKKGSAINPGSLGEAETKMVCAKVGSGPLAGNWVAIGTTGESVDTDSIRRGSDGLVYFTDYDDTMHVTGSEAVDCQRRLIHFGVNFTGLRNDAIPVPPNSFAEAELNLVCAKVR